MNQAQILQHQATTYEEVLPAENAGQPVVQPQQSFQQPQQSQQSQQPIQPTQDPKLQKWIGENPWFNNDVEMTNLTLGIHKNLTEKHGISPYSDEYYSRVDSRLREIYPKFFGVTENKGKVEPAASHVPSVVASTSRQGGGGRPQTVQLTTSAAELAERLGLTVEQYGRQVLKDRIAKDA